MCGVDRATAAARRMRPRILRKLRPVRRVSFPARLRPGRRGSSRPRRRPDSDPHRRAIRRGAPGGGPRGMAGSVSGTLRRVSPPATQMAADEAARSDETTRRTRQRCRYWCGLARLQESALACLRRDCRPTTSLPSKRFGAVRPYGHRRGRRRVRHALRDAGLHGIQPHPQSPDQTSHRRRSKREEDNGTDMCELLPVIDRGSAAPESGNGG